MCANGLIIGYQFILLKIKINAFFSISKKLSGAQHIEEYFVYCPEANLDDETMVVKVLLRSMESYSSCIDKMSFWIQNYIDCCVTL